MSNSQPSTMEILTPHDFRFLYGSALAIIARLAVHPLQWQSSLLLFGSEKIHFISQTVLSCWFISLESHSSWLNFYCYKLQALITFGFPFGPKVECCWNENQRQERKDEVEKRRSTLIVLKLLSSHLTFCHYSLINYLIRTFHLSTCRTRCMQLW